MGWGISAVVQHLDRSTAPQKPLRVPGRWATSPDLGALVGSFLSQAHLQNNRQATRQASTPSACMIMSHARSQAAGRLPVSRVADTSRTPHCGLSARLQFPPPLGAGKGNNKLPM